MAAVEELAGRCFAGTAVTPARVVVAFEARRRHDESAEQAMRVAGDVAMAFRISELLGCETVRCLAAVSAAHSRRRLLEDMKAKALAMPKSTVKLLSALPLVTIALGEALGARPLSFLFGSVGGLICLLAGAVCYIAGLIWMEALMRQLRSARFDARRSGISHER
ncbi:hypothetical protein GFD17_09970 [Bifidobacterium sp. SMB2]|uniref:Pilus assembly protein n=1 Tax=Bifidobacterium saimiriisciurei TaxID=2661627 RepID=A0ABX0CBV4_9BIFI|nr:hypothetical protein [Bifidobacterium sp. SMB2]NEH12151.1 hypothetical protein [Bifidobacterium saimiriisciurei]